MGTMAERISVLENSSLHHLRNVNNYAIPNQGGHAVLEIQQNGTLYISFEESYPVLKRAKNVGIEGLIVLAK